MTEIVADNVEFLEWGDKNKNNQSENQKDSFGDGFQAIEDVDDKMIHSTGRRLHNVITW